MSIADLVSKFRSRFSTYTPVVHLLEDSATGLPTNQRATDQAAHVIEAGVVGGERNTQSNTNNYDVVKQECNVTRVIGTTETLISPAPAYLLGVYANNGATPSSGYTSLRDANVTGGGSTPILVPRATGGDAPDLKASRFENGITAQGSAAGTDVTILWRPI